MFYTIDATLLLTTSLLMQGGFSGILEYFLHDRAGTLSDRLIEGAHAVLGLGVIRCPWQFIKLHLQRQTAMHIRKQLHKTRGRTRLNPRRVRNPCSMHAARPPSNASSQIPNLQEPRTLDVSKTILHSYHYTYSAWSQF